MLMRGRIGCDGRCRRRLRADVAHHHTMLGIVGNFLHRVVGGREVDIEKTAGVNDGTFCAQFVPDRVRIFRPARVGIVKIVQSVTGAKLDIEFLRGSPPSDAGSAGAQKLSKSDFMIP